MSPAHPPLATLVFWVLDRVGLGGGFWAGALCILVSSARRGRGAGHPARARGAGRGPPGWSPSPPCSLARSGWPSRRTACSPAWPRPGSRWSARARARAPAVLSLAGGLLLGAAVYLSYGLVLFGIVVRGRDDHHRRAGAGWRPLLGPWLVAGARCARWSSPSHLGRSGSTGSPGWRQLRVRYYQGIASERPFSYFVCANLAAWLVSCSPLLAVGLTRRGWSGRPPAPRRPDAGRGPRRGAAGRPGRGSLAALVADLSAPVQGRDRTDLAGLRGDRVLRAWRCSAVRRPPGPCSACAGSALLVNHLFDTGW